MAVCALISVTPAKSSPNKNDSIYISGRVKESLGKFDLTDAMVYMLDRNGYPVDSVKADKGWAFRDGENYRMSFFGFRVPKCDSTYVMEVTCPKYSSQIINFEVKDIGKRETSRDIPTVYLVRAPRQLKDVTVTATKIKFYNRGDTIVYNADAFELAEGSMLDALITQLPGVELKEGGQIYVNGQLVESLLLNGREFFDNNNELMLENIGAYAVKNIEVYQGNTLEEKWRGKDDIKHLTMDVKLKREYNTGLTANIQAGYGTRERHSARLFALWYNATTRLTLLGNVNNLNDTRKPGQRDSWKPEMMPSGTRTYKMGGFDYDYVDADETKRIHGSLSAESTGSDNRNTTYTTNFLSGGDTYENSFSKSRDRNLRLYTSHTGFWHGRRWDPFYCVKGIYQDKDNDSENLSGTFSQEQRDMTAEALRAIYSDGSQEALQAILNRASTRSDGKKRSGEIQFFPGVDFHIPKTDDRISNEFGVRYRVHKDYIWKDYSINYGADPTPADVRRQYIDNTPHTFLQLQNNLRYMMRLDNLHLSINYEYKFINETKDSYQYALDRLKEMGVYGTLPAGWAGTLDPKNSYTSRLLEHYHIITPTINYHKREDNKYFLFVNFSPDFTFRHSHLRYERDNTSYPLRKSFFLTSFGGWSASVELMTKVNINGDGVLGYSHHFQFTMDMTPRTPNVFDMTNVVDDSNPLNIYVGNPDLKVEYRYAPKFRYSYIGKEQHPIMNHASISYAVTKNALTRGYTYDTRTGVRTSKMYNVDGNREFGINNDFNLQFGKANQFTLSATTGFTASRYADMIGTDSEEPSLSKVNNTNISQRISLAWKIDKQSLEISGDFLNRHSYSSREDFQSINARHFSYGARASFKLPYNFGIATDFIIYTRRGYGVKQLDTTDAIWNARLTWTPPTAKQWTLMLDGFDMLHQLSNVNYAVSASGRTVSYSNALPRYMMLSVQYRFQRAPKKR